MKEVFKILKDTRNSSGHGRSAGSLWEVSNLGRIRKNGIIVEGHIGKNGYVYVGAGCLLHRAIAQLFIDNPDNKPHIDHIDGNKLNNRVDNLRWVTCKENMNNPITRPRLHHEHAKPSKMIVIQRSKDYTGRKWLTDGDKEYFVKPENFKTLLENGLYFGRLRQKQVI